MILVDTSVWVSYLRGAETALAARLEAGQVLTHPFVVGELATGNLRDRGLLLGHLRRLPAALCATDDEVLTFVEREGLFGRGVGYVDAHLLASVRLTPDARLWTADRRLRDLAADMHLAP